MTPKNIFDLIQLNAMATDFYLLIVSAKELKVAIGSVFYDIS
jgi:hypothetical protein